MSPSNNKSLTISFLQFSVRSYISARILYLNNQLHDAGVMSHEAFEKVMKALIYFKDPNYVISEIHDLNKLKTLLFHTFGYDELKNSKDIFIHYEDCYSYRYPFKKQPKSFSTGTNKFQPLNNIFFYFHEECLKEIKNDNVKFLAGIFAEATSYFKSNDPRDLYKIIKSNNTFNIVYFNEARDYWHSKGCYIKDSKGFTCYLDGSFIREH